MLTRGYVSHQYGQHALDYSPPPFHVYHSPGAYAPSLSRAQLYGAGGLLGGAVTLTARGWVGSKIGNTGYGYLGMDPSAPSTWPRPFNPQPGMISFLNFPGGGQPGKNQAYDIQPVR